MESDTVYCERTSHIPKETVSMDLSPTLPDHPELFISYASADRDRVFALVERLRETGLSIWIDTSGIAGGTAYGTEIASALKEAGAVVLMCSEASLASKNVRQEIMLAWRYERPIVPLILEPTTFPDDIAYWLEGSQWIEVLDQTRDEWLRDVAKALQAAGLEIKVDVGEDGSSDQVPEFFNVRGNLPERTAPLVGREQEIKELQRLLANSDFVTLSGPGGTGKTELALEIARRSTAAFPAGCWLVDLAAVSIPGRIVREVVSTLDLREMPGADPRETIAHGLGGERGLLLLDNVEQIPDVGLEIERLLDVPGVAVLATSRIPLNSPREWVYQVPLLTLPELNPLPPPAVLLQNPAIKLFVERARESKPDFVLSDGNARAVAEICHRLDGLPLAIELAAARVRLLPPGEILTRLGSSLSLLSRGRSGTSDRHRTLREAIAWSYRLLSEPEKLTFERLGAFVGGCSIDAAEVVVAGPGDIDAEQVLPALSALADHNLVVIRTGSNGMARARMLETIREYALEVLESGKDDVVAETVDAYFADYIVGRDAELRNPKPGTTISEIHDDDANLSATLDRLLQDGSGGGGRTKRMVRTMVLYWRARGQLTEATERIQMALRRYDGDDPSLQADLLSSLGFVSSSLGDHTAADRVHRKALELRRTASDRSGEADSLFYLARVASDLGDPAEARNLLDEALQMRREIGDSQGEAAVLHRIGMEAAMMGSLDEAVGLITQALAIYRRSSSAIDLGIALDDLGTVYMLIGRFDEALRYQAESTAIWRSLDDRYALSWCCVNNARALQLAGRHVEAVERFREAIALFEETGEPTGIGVARYGLGLIAIDRGEYAEARELIHESYAIATRGREPWYLAERLEALAELETISGAFLRGARLLGAAARLREVSGSQSPKSELWRVEQTERLLRDALGEIDFEREFASASEIDATELIDRLANLVSG